LRHLIISDSQKPSMLLHIVGRCIDPDRLFFRPPPIFSIRLNQMVFVLFV